MDIYNSIDALDGVSPEAKASLKEIADRAHKIRDLERSYVRGLCIAAAIAVMFIALMIKPAAQAIAIIEANPATSVSTQID